MFLIGVDLGHTHVKAMAFDESGDVLAEASLPSQDLARSRFAIEGRTFEGLVNPNNYVNAALHVLKDLFSKLPPGPVTVAVTGAGPPVVATDEDGEPVAPVIGYWPGVTSEELVEALPMDRTTYRLVTGYPYDYYPGVFGLAWLCRFSSTICRRVSRVMAIGDYVAYVLSGRFAGELSSAAACGAWDYAGNQWSEEILDRGGLSRKWFSELVAPGTWLGRLRPELHLAPGRSVDIAVGGHDTLCAALAADIRRQGDCLDSLGTYEVVLRVGPKGIWPESGREPIFFHDAHVIENLTTTASEIMAGGLIEWARQVICSGDMQTSTAELLATCALVDPSPIRVEPALAFSLESLIEWRNRGQPLTISGLTTDTRPADMVRALLEGISLMAASMVETLDEVSGSKADRIVVAGGATRSRFWSQMKADMLGRTIEIPAVGNASTWGAALLAGKAAGVYDSWDSIAAVTRQRVIQFHPDAEASSLYRQKYESSAWRRLAAAPVLG